MTPGDKNCDPGVHKPPVVVITGPTASGKTSLALKLMERMASDRLSPEMVNADSIQLYSGFDIGSAKPSEAELSRFPSHLFSVYRPDEHVDVARFQTDADQIIREIVARGGLPVIVGGTGLYIQVLLNGIFRYSFSAEIGDASNGLTTDRLVPTRFDPLEIERRNILYQELLRCDPYSAELLAPADIVRVKRALQVFQETGESLRRLQEQHAYADRKYRALVLTIDPDRERLYTVINERLDQMFRHGLLEETQNIISQYGADIHPLGALGYRHALKYLNGEFDLDRAIELAKRDTRRYAKRQLTWWRNQPSKLRWIETTAVNADNRAGRVSKKRGAEQPLSGAFVEEAAYGIISSFMMRDIRFSNDEIFYAPLPIGE